MQVTLYGVRSKREEVPHRADLKKSRQTHIRQYQQKKERMVAEQSMIQTITQVAIKAAEVAIMAVRVADNAINIARTIHTPPSLGGPTLRQPLYI